MDNSDEQICAKCSNLKIINDVDDVNKDYLMKINTQYYEDESLQYYVIKNSNNEYHCYDDVPSIIEFGRNGLINLLQYHKEGKLHRQGDNPSLVEYYDNGSISCVQYFNFNKLHREDDKPSVIMYNKDGSLDSELYYLNGIKHREGIQPASIVYRKGIKHRLSYYKHGKLLKETEVDDYKRRDLNKKRKSILKTIDDIIDNDNGIY